MAWPIVELSEVIKQDQTYVTALEPVMYKKLSVKLFGRGVVPDKPVDGASVLMKRHQFAREGQIIVSEIWAKKGALGIVPPEGDGALCTSHFFLFDIDTSRLVPRWFHYLTVGNYFEPQISRAARGTTGYASVRPKRFLQCVIPLPPPDEQRHMVSRLDRVSMRIAERRQALVAAEREISALLRKAFDKATEGADYPPMERVAPLVRRPVDVQPDESYPELGVRSFGRGTFHKPALDGTAVGTKKLYRIAPRDLVFNIVFAWEGAVAIARDEDEGRVGSHRFLTCVPVPGAPSVEFLLYYFLSREGLRSLGEASPGGAGRNRTLGLKKLAAITVPVPSPEKQRWFNRLQAKVQALREAHAETSGELDTLIPAMLHEVFDGEAGCSAA